jgi:hypothetical protein
MNDVTVPNSVTEPGDLVLAWPDPAASWFEAAPVGNGRLGAMVFGGVTAARLQVNDSTVWSGTPDGPAEDLDGVLAAGAGPERLEQLREAIRARDYRRAEALAMTFEGRYSQEYLPFADLWMSLYAPGPAVYGGRTLNLDNGIAAEEMRLGDRTVQRLVWASNPAGVICVAITVRAGPVVDNPVLDNTVDLRLRLSSPLRTVHQGINEDGLSLGAEIPVDGAPRHEPEVAEPLRYAAATSATIPAAASASASADGYDAFGAIAVAVETDGRVVTMGNEWSVRGMTRALITLASSTSAGDLWLGSPPRTRAGHVGQATEHAREVLAMGEDMLYRAHQADLRGLLGQTSLTIGDRRGGVLDVQEEILSGKDERLTATVMFQLGRYLLASASRPDAGPPANLQGIWNDDLRPAWSSNYTLNINTEMNYWGAEPAGLAECHLPLFDLMDQMARHGRAVSRDLYGARGWVAHHNTDMWGWALAAGMGHGAPSWAIWMMGGVWLAQHVWDHFEYGGDVTFLRERGWPLLRGCAEFCLDWLVDGEDGGLDTIPSTSPENLFLTPGGRAEALSYSTAMDMALIRALFDHCLQAAEVLGLEDDPLRKEIRSALPRLRPPRITRDGYLAEWAEDHAEQDPQHRHLAPLVALYPLDQIDPERTPGLAAAATRLLDRRGPGAMGWSWAWKIALRARLGDAAAARGLLCEATRPLAGAASHDAPVDGSRWGGLLPNLLSTHPPFQIDGNYGFVAAIAEMILQSHGGVVRVLPALPPEWPDGRVHGLRCRGGIEADLSWRHGELSLLRLRRPSGEQNSGERFSGERFSRDGERQVLLRYGPHDARLTVRPGDDVLLGPDLQPMPGNDLGNGQQLGKGCGR